MKPSILKKTGETTDGKTVIAGVYRVFETYGIPLDIILDSIKQLDAVPDWLAFIEEAKTAGVSFERAILKLESAITDVYDVETKKEIMKRLNCKGK